MELTIVPYEVVDILDSEVDLLMLMSIDEETWLPYFETRRVDKEPYFEYNDKLSCDLKKGLRGFMSFKVDTEDGRNYSQCTRIDDSDVDFSLYTKIFDDYHIGKTPHSYEYHFRDWKLKRLLG